MARFLKHIGKHGDRKVAVVFRQVPDEAHMALVIYTETLNQNMHDPIMSCIESDIGQTSRELADAFSKSYTRDGKIILNVLHNEGMIKKVNSENIIMTPAPGQHIRLDELNKLLNEMEQGEAAVRRLAELDASRGLQDPADIARRMRGETPSVDRQRGAVQAQQGALGDNELANGLRAQAAKMNLEAQGLLREAERLLQEASTMDGTSTAVAPAPGVVVPKKRGRVKKVSAVS